MPPLKEKLSLSWFEGDFEKENTGVLKIDLLAQLVAGALKGYSCWCERKLI